MKTRGPKIPARRAPKQRRARQTVEAVLDAAVRILKRQGADAVTTNRIAEVAGVSIGSLYQYFPDKRAIFVALHRRHVEQIDRIVERKLIEHAASPLDVLVRGIIEAMVDAHSTEPELHEMLWAEVPHRAEAMLAFPVRIHGAFRLAIGARARGPKVSRDLDTVVFVVSHMVEALSHGAILHRPKGLSLAAAKREAVRAVLAYLHAALRVGARSLLHQPPDLLV